MSDRWLKMIEKYGSEEEARAEMKRRADKSKRNKGGSGGFASMDKDILIEISKRGGMNGKRKPKVTKEKGLDSI